MVVKKFNQIESAQKFMQVGVDVKPSLHLTQNAMHFINCVGNLINILQ